MSGIATNFAATEQVATQASGLLAATLAQVGVSSDANAVGGSSSSWLDRALSLGRLSASGEGVSLRFAWDVPLWAWFLIAVACALVAGWSYWRLTGPAWSRGALATLRGLLLMLLACLIAGPQLVKENPRIENDAVVLMLDRSASMTVQDIPGGSGERRSRDAQLREALEGAWPALREMSAQRDLIVLGFDEQVRDLALPSGGGVPALGEADGARTLIGQGLEAALRRASSRPLAGVVLLSDGRSGDTPSRGVLGQLAARQTPVFAGMLGSAVPLADIAVSRVDAPSAAFLGDQVPVTVEVERRGDAGTDAPGGKLELVDDATGLVLSEVPLREGTAGRYTLVTRPDRQGNASWSVRLVLPMPDLSDENNSAPVRLELVDRPIRVVYIDGYPRWEYRYLKNLLLREGSIRSSAWILSADKRFVQEGSDPLAVIPRTRDEWAGIDVIILGDVRASLFGAEQLESLRWLIAERGAGVLMVAGPGSMPATWRESALADLIPFTAPGGSGEIERYASPVLMFPAPGAQRLGVLTLGSGPEEPWPAALADPSLGWPRLQWAQRIESGWLKPTAEVLAEARPADRRDVAGNPLVLTMRYGAGRSVYVGTDETWRYRFGRGETLPERFWIPLIRLLARESLSRGGKPAVLEATPQRARVDEPVRISLRLLDQKLVAAAAGQPARVRVARISRVSPGASSATEEIVLNPERPDAEDVASQPASFAASWTGLQPGVYSVEPVSPWLAGLELSARVEVALPEDELRFPQADHAALASLASATGGRTFEPGELAQVLGELPNRRVTLLGTPDIETLWDKPIMLILMLLLAGAEWIGRRVIKLA